MALPRMRACSSAIVGRMGGRAGEPSTVPESSAYWNAARDRRASSLGDGKPRITRPSGVDTDRRLCPALQVDPLALDLAMPLSKSRSASSFLPNERARADTGTTGRKRGHFRCSIEVDLHA